MKQIDLFVDQIYHNVAGNKQEILDLKTEMKGHLLEAVHEFIAEGKSEQEAINLAISRFGEEKEIRSVIGQLFQVQRTFAKWLLFLAVTILILSFITYGLDRNINESNAMQLSDVATEIRDILGEQETITSTMGKEIETYIKETNFISSVKIYNVSKVEESDYGQYNMFDYAELELTPAYEFKRSVWAPEWLNPKFYPYGNGDDKWVVMMEERAFNIPAMAFLVGLAVYWTLFAIWAIVNAYHNRRLSIAWIIIFSIFNVVGYGLYRLLGKKNHN